MHRGWQIRAGAALRMTWWITLLKIGLPVAAVAALYFWAHDAGWRDRDGTVQAEVQDAVNEAVNKERKECATEQESVGVLIDELQKQKNLANNQYADAIAKLYDATHSAGGSPAKSSATGSDNGVASGGRLYYADAAGAIPALQRAKIATDQANQLIGCQAYINSVVAPK